MASSQDSLAPIDSLDGIDIVVLNNLDQYRQTLEMQERVWGFADIDKVPARLFTVATHIGGLALGVYRQERMVGFSLAMPGKDAAGEPFLHSHMTGLLPELQGRGLGQRVKMRQRLEAQKLGYRTIQWTFDPLEIRNAYFNIHKLGVIVRHYKPNMYGITSSKLHGGIPTDRLVAEWRLDRDPTPPPPTEEEVEIPADVRATPERAAEVQTRVRARFEELFAAGYQAVAYRRTPDGGAYGLARS